jgi:hypothetical protein
MPTALATYEGTGAHSSTRRPTDWLIPRAHLTRRAVGLECGACAYDLLAVLAVLSVPRACVVNVQCRLTIDVQCTVDCLPAIVYRVRPCCRSCPCGHRVWSKGGMHSFRAEAYSDMLSLLPLLEAACQACGEHAVDASSAAISAARAAGVAHELLYARLGTDAMPCHWQAADDGAAQTEAGAARL